MIIISMHINIAEINILSKLSEVNLVKPRFSLTGIFVIKNTNNNIEKIRKGGLFLNSVSFML